MSVLIPDQDLLERLAAAAASGTADPDDCEQLAARLTALGASAAAARWRSWGLLAPDGERLRAEIERARRWLAGESSAAQQVVEVAPPAGWLQLEQRLAEAAGPTELEFLAWQLRPALTDGAVEPLLELSQRLVQAGAPRAALVLLDPLMPAGRQEPRIANRLAEVQRACGNGVQAELWSRLSLRVQPRQPFVWFQLARLLLEEGAPDEALGCAEAGLLYAPGQPWGLKLRARALVASRGWWSYDRLAQAGALPEDPQFRAHLEAERARYRRQARLGLRRPAPPGLEERLRLRGLLRPIEAPVLLVHGRSGEPLRWLLEAGVWSQPPPVVPHASRDPLRLVEELTAAGFVVQPEQPLLQLAELGTVGLLVVDRAVGRRLPRLLAEPLRRARLVLAPQGLLALAGRPLLRCAGWELRAAAAGGDG